MSTKLKTSHSFPKYRTIENSDISPNKQSADDNDDDIYIKDYLKYSIDQLRETKSGIVGCRDMLIFFPECEGKMVMIRGSSIHEATMVHTKRHWKTNRYHKNTMKGEGTRMVNGNYKNDLDIRRVMICVAHGENTYGKSRFLECPEVEMSKSAKDNLIGMVRGELK